MSKYKYRIESLEWLGEQLGYKQRRLYELAASGALDRFGLFRVTERGDYRVNVAVFERAIDADKDRATDAEVAA